MMILCKVMVNHMNYSRFWMHLCFSADGSFQLWFEAMSLKGKGSNGWTRIWTKFEDVTWVDESIYSNPFISARDLLRKWCTWIEVIISPWLIDNYWSREKEGLGLL